MRGAWDIFVMPESDEVEKKKKDCSIFQQDKNPFKGGPTGQIWKNKTSNPSKVQ